MHLNFLYSAELVLKRLQLHDVLAHELERLREEAVCPAQNAESDPVTRRKDKGYQDARIMQTQRMLVNIQRKNQEDQLRDEPPARKRKASAERSKATKRLRPNNTISEEISSSSDVDEDELPSVVERTAAECPPDNAYNSANLLNGGPDCSVFGSPEFSSTLIQGKSDPSPSAKKLAIFKYSGTNSDDDDDTIFDFPDL